METAACGTQNMKKITDIMYVAYLFFSIYIFLLSFSR